VNLKIRPWKLSSLRNRKIKLKKSEQCLKDKQDTIKWTSIHTVGILKGEEKENRVERI
jgi:hypothetical protein